jgi:hypothetical protein
MIELDFRYVTYRSVTNDLKLIMRTPLCCSRRHAA